MRLFKRTIAAVRQGLARTANAFGVGLRSLLVGRRLDDEVVDEIEARLIAADVGVRAATEIVGELRQSVKSGELERGEDAIEFLKTRLKSRWDGDIPEIASADACPAALSLCE